MKTTIDFPEELLHRAKIAAAQRKTTLKELVLQGLDYAISHPVSEISNAEAERRAKGQKLLKLLSKGRNTESVGKFNRDEIYDRDKGKWD